MPHTQPKGPKKKKIIDKSNHDHALIQLIKKKKKTITPAKDGLLEINFKYQLRAIGMLQTLLYHVPNKRQSKTIYALHIYGCCDIPFQPLELVIIT